MQYSADELQQKFDSLPEDVKQAMTSVDFAEVLQFIGKENGLMLDQVDKLFEEVGYVMLGIVKPADFASRIVKTLGVSQVAALPIIKGVDEAIFKPIRDSLMSMHETHVRHIDVRDVASGKTSSENSANSNEDHDVGMSRDAILAAIENPLGKKPTLSENTVPKTFLTDTSNANVKTSTPSMAKPVTKMPWDEVPKVASIQTPTKEPVKNEGVQTINLNNDNRTAAKIASTLSTAPDKAEATPLQKQMPSLEEIIKQHMAEKGTPKTNPAPSPTPLKIEINAPAQKITPTVEVPKINSDVKTDIPAVKAVIEAVNAPAPALAKNEFVLPSTPPKVAPSSEATVSPKKPSITDIPLDFKTRAPRPASNLPTMPNQSSVSTPKFPTQEIFANPVPEKKKSVMPPLDLASMTTKKDSPVKPIADSEQVVKQASPALESAQMKATSAANQKFSLAAAARELEKQKREALAKKSDDKKGAEPASIFSPASKLAELLKTSTTKTSLTPKDLNNPTKAEEVPRKAVDPYREPIS